MNKKGQILNLEAFEDFKVLFGLIIIVVLLSAIFFNFGTLMQSIPALQGVEEQLTIVKMLIQFPVLMDFIVGGIYISMLLVGFLIARNTPQSLPYIVLNYIVSIFIMVAIIVMGYILNGIMTSPALSDVVDKMFIIPVLTSYYVVAGLIFLITILIGIHGGTEE